MSKASGSAASGPSSSSSSPQQQTPGVAVMPAEDNFDFLFKIVLIGDCGTGKTCVVQRFKSGTYAENQGNTIGVDFSMKTIKIDGKKVKVGLQGCCVCVSDLINHFCLLCYSSRYGTRLAMRGSVQSPRVTIARLMESY